MRMRLRRVFALDEPGQFTDELNRLNKLVASLRKECNALNTKNEILQQRLEEKEKDKIECASIHT